MLMWYAGQCTYKYIKYTILHHSQSGKFSEIKKKNVCQGTNGDCKYYMVTIINQKLSPWL